MNNTEAYESELEMLDLFLEEDSQTPEEVKRAKDLARSMADFMKKEGFNVFVR